MPKGDPAGYLPSVKAARKQGKKTAAQKKKAVTGTGKKLAGNPMSRAVPRY